MEENKGRKHFCPPASGGGKRHRVICLGAIKGKVLVVERVSGEQNKNSQKSWKIKISEWKNSKFDKEYVISYDPKEFGKKPLRPFPEKGKVYWFFLHKIMGSGKNSQHGWQLVHDWQLAEEGNLGSDKFFKSNLWLWLIGGLIVLAIIVVVICFWPKN